MIRIGNKTAKHLYEIGTQHGRIAVDANTRAQAASIAKKAGYEIHDVNMVG